MGCITTEDSLIPFHFGTLDAVARATVEAHLVSCPACLQAYLGVKRSVELGAATFTPRPSPRARARLRTEIAATFAAVAVPKPSVAGRRLGWASLGAVAAALAFALFSPGVSLVPFAVHGEAKSFAPTTAAVIPSCRRTVRKNFTTKKFAIRSTRPDSRSRSRNTCNVLKGAAMRIAIWTGFIAFFALSSVSRADDYAKKGKPFVGGEKAFQQVKAILSTQYFDTVSEEDLYRGAVAGMLSSAGGRKWDALLSPMEYAMLTHELEGQIAGIGVEIDMSSQPGVITIVGTLPNSPAERAELRGGDRILKVNGKSVREHTEDAAHSIAGKPGSTVALTILRDDQILDKTLTRASVVVPAVSDHVLPDGTALVWIRTFNNKTPALLEESLARLSGKKLRGLVIDLRHNQGGLFDKMIDCAGELLPRGSAVVIEQQRGKQFETLKTARDPVLSNVAIVVLSDGSTASSAEMLAGALRDVMHARLIGSRTQGKWNGTANRRAR